MDRDLTSETFTFVFSDIEGSTRMLRALGDGYAQVLRDHDAIIRAAADENRGRAFGSEGDAQHLVFTDASAAVAAAVEAQRALAGHEWPPEHPVRVRMGVHTGKASREGDDFIGMTLHETARIAAAGHGGQVLVSPSTHALAQGSLPTGVSFHDLGEHRLKDIESDLRLYQLDIEGLESAFPALRTLGPGSAVLPTQLSSFVGRSEVDALAEVVGSSRLTTLTGPGGTGKTRLAIRVAAETADAYPDGTYFVALDAISDPDLVVPEIASVLSVPSGTESTIERVCAHLRDRSMLLVLDNLEQVIDMAPQVGRILREAPGVRIIATSRIPLHIDGEREFPVPALRFPPPGEVLEPESASDFEAVRLFAERARAARPDFALDATTVPVVVDIVARLDGLPLAIELAAARLRMLTLTDLRDRLTSSTGVLGSGSRDAPERQRTLRGAIEWSHRLLEEPERRLLARFSVMAGGATIPMTETVCGPPDEVGRDIFDGLESLSEHSLIRLDPMATSETRFEMLMTIREFARERLESSEDAARIRERHARAFLALAQEAEPLLQGIEGARWNDRLEADHDNLRAALEWIVGNDRADLGLAMVAAVWRFWQVRGHLDEGEAWSAAVLALPSVTDQAVELQIAAQRAAGSVAYWRVDIEAAYRRYQRALELARGTEDLALLADTVHDAAYVSIVSDDWVERWGAGITLWQESLALHRELGDDIGVAADLWALGSAALSRGDMSSAIELSLESLALSREAGDPFRVGWGGHAVGLVMLAAGRLDEATSAFLESLDVWEPAGDIPGIEMVVLDVGLLAEARGRQERSWQLIGAADSLRQRSGSAIVLGGVEGSGWTPRLDPENEKERRLFAEGRRLSMAEAIALAREELNEE